VSVSTARESSNELVHVTPIYGGGTKYDVSSNGYVADIFWTNSTQLMSCTFDESLAPCEPVSLFHVRDVAVTKHGPVTVLATTRPNGMVEIHLPLERPPRRRGVRR
jgi:hypothetical protein